MLTRDTALQSSARRYGCNTVPDSGNSCSGFASNAHIENKSIPWASWVHDIRTGYLARRAASGQCTFIAHTYDKGRCTQHMRA